MHNNFLMTVFQALYFKLSWIQSGLESKARKISIKVGTVYALSRKYSFTNKRQLQDACIDTHSFFILKFH